MSISWRVLGNAGSDNAAYARIETGQAVHRLLFDCGAGCPSALEPGEVRAIDRLIFSHLHMDHIGGFDTFFRANYNRPTKPVEVWGPPETIRILHHRFRGFLWNLYKASRASGACMTSIQIGSRRRGSTRLRRSPRRTRRARVRGRGG